MTGPSPLSRAGPIATGASPEGIAITPEGGFLYVADTEDNCLSAFRIAADGKLSPLAPATVAAGTWPEWLAISPDGKHLYVTNFGSADGTAGLSAFSIGTDGDLSPLSTPTYTTGGSPSGIVVSPDGKYLYVSSNTSSAFSIDAATGLLTPIAGTFATAYGQALAIRPSGTDLYVGSMFMLCDYGIGAGGSPAIRSTQMEGINRNGTAVTPDGSWLYVSDASMGNVTVFAIATDGSVGSAGVGPYSLGAGFNGAGMQAISPDGKTLYTVTNDGVYACGIGTGGALSQVGTGPVNTGTGPFAIAVRP